MITEYANSYYTLGSIEGITIAIFFGGVGIASLVALSPIVGAFAIGMAVASTQLIKQVEIGNNKGKGNIQNIFI
jgi:Kef-type K+ transport system membrane component KefB